jgi:hypothetical protein
MPLYNEISRLALDVLGESLIGRNHLTDLGAHGKIILKWILKI